MATPDHADPCFYPPNREPRLRESITVPSGVRRPRAVERPNARYLAVTAALAEATPASDASCAKYESNLNQIAKQANAGALERTQNLAETAIQECRAQRQMLQDILRDCFELRTMCMQAFGLEGERKVKDMKIED
jgi:hypothetical protein